MTNEITTSSYDLFVDRNGVGKGGRNANLEWTSGKWLQLGRDHSMRTTSLNEDIPIAYLVLAYHLNFCKKSNYGLERSPSEFLC